MQRYRHSLFVTLLAIAACSSENTGDKCKENCRAICPGKEAPTAAELVNCDNGCDDLQARAEERACDDEQSELYDCAAVNQCKATFVADCRAQSDALDACNLAYCRAHTSDPDC